MQRQAATLVLPASPCYDDDDDDDDGDTRRGGCMPPRRRETDKDDGVDFAVDRGKLFLSSRRSAAAKQIGGFFASFATAAASLMRRPLLSMVEQTDDEGETGKIKTARQRGNKSP